MEEKMDVSQYLEIFLDETNEHLQNLNTQILELESDPENMDNINEIFRAAHSLKGMAGTMGYKRMQNLTHDMENVFSEVRNGNIKVKPEMIDVLFQCLDALEEYKNNIQETSDEGTNDNENLIKALNDILNDGKTEEAPAAKEEAPTATAPAAESGADGGEKWNDIAFDDSQIRKKSVLFCLRQYDRGSCAGSATLFICRVYSDAAIFNLKYPETGAGDSGGGC